MKNEIFNFIEKRKRAPLIGYLPALFPDNDGFLRIVRQLAEGGLKFIEVGMPTATPFLDGELIKGTLSKLTRANRSISAFNIDSGKIITACGLNGITMLYEHTLIQYGIRELVSDCAECGISAVLVPDITMENRRKLFVEASKTGVEVVSFAVTGLSEKEMKEIIGLTSGFLYLQSSEGPTGGQFSVGESFLKRLDMAKRLAAPERLPVGVGFGINSPADAVEAEKAGADAVIVGTSFLKAVIGGDNKISGYLSRFRQFLEVA